MANYEESAQYYTPTGERDDRRQQATNSELGFAALTLSAEDGSIYAVEKRSIELTYAAGVSVIERTGTQLVEAKTHAHQNKLKANVLGNGLLSRIDARASLIKGTAASTERTVTARMTAELSDVETRLEAVAHAAAERIATLEAEAEEKIRQIRVQLEHDTDLVTEQRDEALGLLQDRKRETEEWGESNLQTLATNRDAILAAFEERVTEIRQLVEHQVSVNTAAHGDLESLEQKLAGDQVELDRMRLRASELYDVYVQRMREKAAIDERVQQAGGAIDAIHAEHNAAEIDLAKLTALIGEIEIRYSEAVDLARAKYAGNPTLGAALQHKDPYVVQMMDKKRWAVAEATQLQHRVAELEQIEQARIQNRRPLLSEQGRAIAAAQVARREVLTAYRTMLRMKQSVAEECAKLTIATRDWMDRPVEITVDTADITESSAESAVEIVTRGMTLDKQPRTTEDDQPVVEVPSGVEDSNVVEEVCETPVTDLGEARRAKSAQHQQGWNGNFGIPLVHKRVVDARLAPGIVKMADGTEISFTCDTVASK